MVDAGGREKNYPNGSIWMKHDDSEAGYVKAKNQFGTFWVMQFKSSFNHCWQGEQGVFRRGRKWHLKRTPDGYIWI